MNVIEQAQALQQQAITILMTERDRIDAQLAKLGYGEMKTAPHMKKRGRPAKCTFPQESMELENDSKL